MASLRYPLDIGSAYNFSLLATAILGSGYSGATVTGLLDYSSAILISDVGQNHAAALAELPSGTPSDPRQLIYIKLVTSAGQTVVIAQDWLSQAPVLTQSTSCTIEVSNIAITDIAKLRDILTANGYTSFQISQ